MSGVFLSTPSARKLACLVVDTTIVIASLLFALWTRFSISGWTLEYSTSHVAQLSAAAVTILLALYYNELYGGRSPRSFTHLALALFKAFVTGGLFLTLLFYTFPALELGRGLLLIQVPTALVGLLAWRAFYYFAIQKNALVENVMILGTGTTAVSLARDLIDLRREGYRVVGFLSHDPAEVGRQLLNPTIVGTFPDLSNLADQFSVDTVVVALEDQRGKMPLYELLSCKLRGVRVEEASSFIESLTGQIPVRSVRPSSLIFSPGFRNARLVRDARRVVELVVATVGFVLSLPLLVLAALAIWIESRRPVIFRQERVGEKGNTFTLYKLRTMRADAERGTGVVWAKDGGEPRVTAVGRFLRKSRIDELPQLVNVIRGDMSFVGPRPERPCFVQELKQLIPYYGDRHSVKPGITGWAQVRYGYGSSVEDSEMKLRYDLYYIKNMNLWLDLQILLDTAKVMLLGRGAR